VLLEVLDKKRLYARAREVGMEVPRTWFPESEDDVRRIARASTLPLLVKPRTQVLAASNDKGVVVDDAASLPARWSAFVRDRRHHASLRAQMPEAEVAMLQEYLPEAAGNIVVVAAYLSEDRRHFAARAAVKLMQRPRNLGIGLCFEPAPLSHDLAEAARKLAIASGYHGLFQLELVHVGDRFLLIDFNPRFYNQLAFDIARGLPLPMIVHAAACGDDREVARLLDDACARPPDDELVFCNAFGFRVMLGAQRIAGVMSESEASRWRSWRSRHRARSIDPTRTPDDNLPGLVDVCAQLYGYARHPRAFLRRLVLDEQR
jgi:predicted ATP-grasp superfamily ATP-dependent carboligase